MGNKGASLQAEHMPQTYIYESLEAIEEIAAKIQLITRSIPLVALVAITLQFEVEAKIQGAQGAQAERSADYYLNSLRPLVRKTDIVALVGHTFYFLLLGAKLDGGRIVQTRLWDALLWRVHNTNDGELLRPCYISIGYSAYPIPQREVLHCIEAAHIPILTFGSARLTRKTVSRQSKLASEDARESELPLLARKLGVPYLSLLPQKPPTQVQQLVNPKLAQELHCYPLGRERGTLTVAMSDPKDSSILDRLRRETGLHIFPVLAPPQALKIALEQLV